MSVGPGARLSRYQIVDEISRGGMGVVYRAVDVTLNREVALKVLPADLVSNTDRRERFIQEAQAASALEHPNIAVIHEVGEAGGVSFIAMELIRGEKLADLLATSPLPAARALELAVEIGEALARAHEKGVIHRDLKPANVMVTEQGHAKVIDFGLAKLIGPLAGDVLSETTVAGDTDPGTVLGTVSYMSPEQARGGRVNHRTDIFTFGILLHEMLAARPPFRGPSGVETLHSILNAPPPPLPPLGGNVSPDAAAEIQRVRDKCLEKSPDDRYQGMRDLVVDLRAARRRLESAAVAPVVAPTRRLVWWWAAAAAAIVVSAAGVATLFWPAPAAPASDKPSVAVMYFENNTGNASLDWLRMGLADMLVTDLSQSPNIEVLGTDRLQQILSELNRADDRSVSFDVVQQLARRAGVKTVLVGSYVKSGESIRINVRLQDASDGRIVTAERVEAIGESNLFPTVDDLTRRIRAKLELPSSQGQPLRVFAKPTSVSSETAGIDRDLREVTTSSIEAYRYYAEGINLHERLRDAQAIPLFEKALAIDPNFALAMAKLAVVHGNLNHRAESIEYARRAYEHVDRVTARERFYIEGEHFANREETLAQAIDAFERGLKLHPDHASIRNNLALLYVRLDRRDDALPHYEELRRRGMTFTGTYGTLANIYASRGEFEKGVQVLQEYLQQHPDVAQAHGFLGGVFVAWGKLDDALAAFNRVEALDHADATIGATGKWNVHVLRGQWSEAERIAERLTKSQDSFRRFIGHAHIATVHLYGGRSAAALTSIERAMRVYVRPGANTAQARVRASAVLLAKGNGAAALAEALKASTEGVDAGVEWAAMQAVALGQLAVGRSAEADRTLDELRRRAAQLPSEREIRRVHHLSGQMAVHRGDYARAVEEALAAEKRLPRHPTTGPGGAGPSAAQIHFTLASAYLAAGRPQDAEQWFKRIVEATVGRLNAPIEYVRSLYLLGTIYEKRGEMDKARAHYRRFLEHWRDGDLDREHVADAAHKLRAVTTN